MYLYQVCIFLQAYGWGFDIRSWQRHLNYLTWPEILRQFALSAGFGPQLKKRTIERPYLRDDNEVYLIVSRSYISFVYVLI